MKRTLGFVVITKNGAGDWYVARLGRGSRYTAREQGALFNTCPSRGQLYCGTLFPTLTAARHAVRTSQKFWDNDQRWPYIITRVTA